MRISDEKQATREALAHDFEEAKRAFGRAGAGKTRSTSEWDREVSLHRMLYLLARDDLRLDLEENGELETDRGYWAIDSAGNPVFRHIPEWEASACST